MYVDAVTTAAVASELREQILHGRVQAVIQTDPASLGLEIYANGQRRYLLMTVDPQAARCHLVPDKLRRGVERPAQVYLLMRKYIDGARLMAITQPRWERILWLDFSGDEGEVRLVVETMGKLSNIVLVVGGDILDCMKRIGPDQNRYRTILPGKPYVPPPPQKKSFPDEVTAAVLEEALRGPPDRPAWRVLVDHVAGVSPQFAREIVYRACDDCEAQAFDVAGRRITQTLAEMVADVQAERWYPCVVPAGDAGYRAFAAYQITHLEGSQPVTGISEAMTLYFGAPVLEEAYSAGKEGVKAQIDAARERVQRKLASLKRQPSSDETIELLRKQGELIFAYSHAITPGQTELKAQYDLDGPALTISLDPNLTPSENGQQYFVRYEKAKRAALDLPKMIRETQLELDYLDQLANDLDLAENWPEIEMVRETLQNEGYWQGRKTRGPRSGKPGIRRFTTPDGFVILVGRNVQQNHTLVTTRSKSDDLWLHVRNLPGSHVIIKFDGRDIPDDVIEYAAGLAAYYSAGRGEGTVEVDVTQRRYVRPVKGGKPGLVTYKNERTLSVKPRKS